MRQKRQRGRLSTTYSTTYGRVPFEAPETLPVGDPSYQEREGVYFYEISIICIRVRQVYLK